MKQIFSLIIIVFLLTVIVNLTFSIFSLWSKKDLLTQTKLQLTTEQQEHVQLQKDWQKVNNPSFVEEQARDKLFLGKSGESIVVIPSASPSASVRVQAESTPLWQQWLGLFF